jgi:Rod binding domain-containing protein
MDSIKLLLTSAAPPPSLPEKQAAPESVIMKLAAGQRDDICDAKQKQAAKDFESVLLCKLLDAMKSTIDQWGLDEDSTSKRVHDLFWQYLARDIADHGGFGLWKDIYRVLTDSNQVKTGAEPLDIKG